MNRKLIAVVGSALLLALTAGGVAYPPSRTPTASFTAATTTSPGRYGSSTPRPAAQGVPKDETAAPGIRKPTGTGPDPGDEAAIQAHPRRG